MAASIALGRCASLEAGRAAGNVQPPSGIKSCSRVFVMSNHDTKADNLIKDIVVVVVVVALCVLVTMFAFR